MNNNKRFLFTADSRGVLLGEYLKKFGNKSAAR